MKLEAPFAADEVAIFSSLKLTPDGSHDPTNGLEANATAAELGRRLFDDRRISRNEILSCSTCHVPANNFGEIQRLSSGITGPVQKKTPALRGVARFDWFFHDGRADSLWGQALEVIENAAEFGGDRRSVAALLMNDPDYRRLISRITLTDRSRWLLRLDSKNSDTWLFVLAGKSIAAYLKRQDFKPTRFDRFVDAVTLSHGTEAGDFSKSELRGLRIFVGKGKCILCHRGPRFSDGQFHNIGLLPDRGVRALDAGRYAAIKQLTSREFGTASKYSDAAEQGRAKVESVVASDLVWGAFRTPSLRNSPASASFMHDARYSTLYEVVRFYSTLENQELGHHQEAILSPLNLSDQEVTDLLAFLLTLSPVPSTR